MSGMPKQLQWRFDPIDGRMLHCCSCGVETKGYAGQIAMHGAIEVLACSKACKEAFEEPGALPCFPPIDKTMPESDRMNLVMASLVLRMSEPATEEEAHASFTLINNALQQLAKTNNLGSAVAQWIEEARAALKAKNKRAIRVGTNSVVEEILANKITPNTMAVLLAKKNR